MTPTRHITLQSHTAATSQYFAMVVAQLTEGQSVKLAFGGTSMLPTLRESDTLRLDPIVADPQRGDILLFRQGGMHIVHRLIACTDGRYLMQGDNNYGTETVGRQDLLARLTAVEHADGTVETTDSVAWRRRGQRALRRSAARRLAVQWFGRTGRRKLRPWYFFGLAFLMWAPLNGVGLPLDNYILGLRADHLLHASVYIPCTLFLWDLYKRSGRNGRRWAVWATAVAVGLLTEGVQYLLPYRGYDVNDLVANTLGVTLGWVTLLLVRRRLRR